MPFGLADQTVRDARSYEDACRRHVWRIPADYNIAVDICDRHADGTGRRALVWTGEPGCLLEHPAVEQCAVVGVPDVTRGEAVKAFVLLKPGHGPSPALADELQSHVTRRLGTFQRPREIEWIDELPMTVSGKIKRAELRKP